MQPCDDSAGQYAGHGKQARYAFTMQAGLMQCVHKCVNARGQAAHNDHDRVTIGRKTMTDNSSDAGVIAAIVERFEKFRLPMLLELKEKVDQGERLNDREIEFLEQVLSDADKNKALVERNPEWKDISARVIGLYNEVTAKALENEKKA
jgi:hypothetical protein